MSLGANRPDVGTERIPTSELKNEGVKALNGIQIRVGDMIYAVVKRWKTILFLTLVGCGFGLAWSGVSYVQGNFTDYKISCSVALTAQSATGSFTANSSYLTNNDFHLAEDMVDAAIYIMESDRVIDEAIDKTGLAAVSAEDVTSKLTMERYNETQIVDITLKWNNETTGLQLVNAILSVSRQVLPETLMIGSVAVINEPVSTYIAGGGGMYILPVMCVLGFLFGIGLAVLDLIMRPTLLNLRDVENVLGLETLGAIPKDDVFFRRKISLYEDDSGYSTKQNFTSIAYILRNRIGMKQGHHSFYITSARDGEGKSAVAANLAMAFAEMEKHVLLVDLDTRNPSIGNLFLENTDYNRTLNALYKGEATVQEAVISLTGFLDILPAVLEYNAIPFNNTLFDLVKSLENNYDYVVIDAPAVGQTSDALSLNQIASAALFVIRYDTAPLPDIEDSLSKLDKSGIRILGCVVNAGQTVGAMSLGGARKMQSEDRGKNRRPVSAAMGDESTFEMSPEDDLLTRTASNESVKPANNEDEQKNQSLMDQLTSDPTSNFGRMTDDDALDALYRIGIDGSWKDGDSEENASEIDTSEANTMGGGGSL